MKKFSLLAILAIVTMVFVTSCNSGSTTSNVSLKSDVDSVSFVLGKSNGMQAKAYLKNGLPFTPNKEAFLAGFMEGAKGGDNDTLFLGKSGQDINGYVNEFFQKAQQKMMEETLKEGQDFLAANKSKSGVITTESGLQYKVITEGTGPKPAPEDTVSVNYVGKLLDGTIFDQSREPIKFPLNGVIRGWSEGVQLMPQGSKYTLWIPSELAYGQQGNANIKPNSTLEFEVELLEVIKAKK